MDLLKPPILHKFPVYLRILTFGIVILSCIIFFLILGIVIAVPFFGSDIMDKLALIEKSADPNIIVIAKYFQIVSQFGTFIIPVILFAFLDGRYIGGYLKINKIPSYKAMVFAAIAILAVVPFINFLSEMNQQMSFPASMSDIEKWMKDSEDAAALMTNNFLNVSTIGGFIVNLLMIGIIPAIGEEFMFRGVIQKLFNQWTGNIHLAVIFSAFLFSAIHVQFYGFIPRFLMGVLLGYTFVWSGSLWMPILIHFVNNSAAVIVSYLANNNKIDNTFDTIGTGDAALAPVIISIILSAWFIYLIYYFEKRKRLLLSKSYTEINQV